MKKKDRWEEMEKGKEEDYFLKKHREWLEQKKQGNSDTAAEEDPDKGLACPRCCKTLDEDVRKTLTIFRCSRCGGGWLDEQSLKEILSAPR